MYLFHAIEKKVHQLILLTVYGVNYRSDGTRTYSVTKQPIPVPMERRYHTVQVKQVQRQPTKRD